MQRDTIREGTRGGQGEFRWSAVKEDKDRENYLGHSVNAPQGRWQSKKDIHWYAREAEETDVDKAARERREEIKRLKEAEEDALAVALGFAPVVRDPDGGEGTGANDIKVEKTAKDLEIEALEKEQRAREKALKREQKELKRAEKDAKRKEKEERRAARKGRSHRRSRSPTDSRSRSPDPRRRRDNDRRHSRDRNYDASDRSPRRRRDDSPPRRSYKHENDAERHAPRRESEGDHRAGNRDIKREVVDRR